jgi:hypothetical protein
MVRCAGVLPVELCYLWLCMDLCVHLTLIVTLVITLEFDQILQVVVTHSAIVTTRLVVVIYVNESSGIDRGNT